MFYFTFLPHYFVIYCSLLFNAYMFSVCQYICVVGSTLCALLDLKSTQFRFGELSSIPQSIKYQAQNPCFFTWVCVLFYKKKNPHRSQATLPFHIYKIVFYKNCKDWKKNKVRNIQDFFKILGCPPHPGPFDPLPLYPPMILSNYNLILQHFNYYIFPIR